MSEESTRAGEWNPSPGENPLLEYSRCLGVTLLWRLEILWKVLKTNLWKCSVSSLTPTFLVLRWPSDIDQSPSLCRPWVKRSGTGWVGHEKKWSDLGKTKPHFNRFGKIDPIFRRAGFPPVKRGGRERELGSHHDQNWHTLTVIDWSELDVFTVKTRQVGLRPEKETHSQLNPLLNRVHWPCTTTTRL